MSLFNPLLWVVLFNLSGSVRPPVLSVKVLLATKAAIASKQAQRYDSAEVKRLFSKHDYRHFYLIGENALDFGATPSAKNKTVDLPNSQSAQFIYSGFANGQHVYEFSLPDYGVKAQIKAPPGRTFYQAGIRYNGGVIILRLRAD
ncbi:MAG: hypothetical protein ACPGQS_05245 [Bradymonadia bacterium]